ncbi:MAG: hypothetical protein WAK19_12120, partial [Candidatus Cybelea sp.]
MRVLTGIAATLICLGAVSSGQYQIDQARYFSNALAESTSRPKLTAEAGVFMASATPERADEMRRWLEEYNA